MPGTVVRVVMVMELVCCWCALVGAMQRNRGSDRSTGLFTTATNQPKKSCLSSGRVACMLGVARVVPVTQSDPAPL